jgi:hypothetical protein
VPRRTHGSILYHELHASFGNLQGGRVHVGLDRPGRGSDHGETIRGRHRRPFGHVVDDDTDRLFRIVPSSGTGLLAGIRGTGGMAIDADGTHRIWFDYDLG